MTRARVRTRIAGPQAAAVLIALLHPVAAHAWCRTYTVRPAIPGECNMQGLPLKWFNVCTGFSVYYAGSPDLSLSDIQQAAADGAARWHTEAMCDANGDPPYYQLMPLGITSTPTGYDPHGPNANTVSFNSVWAADASHQDGTIAVTLVTFDPMTGQIFDADVEMNEQSDSNPDGFQFTVGASDPQYADLPTILTHEFGHLHGLAHSADPNAVMFPDASLGEQRRDLTPDDIPAICSVYPPGTAPNESCNPVPYGGLAESPNGGQASGGCSVDQGAHRTGGRARLGLVLAALGIAVAGARRRLAKRA